jgi:cytochrome oxidase assembly protein ShyY1
LALLVLALAVASVCALLGQWQAERSQSTGGRPELERAVPLIDVLAPATTFTGAVDGQVVTAAGEFTGGEQVVVRGRLQDGAPGRWVVAPLAVVPADGGEPALLPVVRGWAPGETGPVPPPPQGPVQVRGRLIAGEPPQGVSTGPDGAAVVRAVSPADLVNVWDSRLYTGFLIAAEPVPDPPLQVVPSRAPSGGTDWRSLSYALQWWLFAAFAVVVWWRLVRDRYLLPPPGAAGDGAGQDGWEDPPAAPAHPPDPAAQTASAAPPLPEHQEAR